MVILCKIPHTNDRFLLKLFLIIIVLEKNRIIPYYENINNNLWNASVGRDKKMNKVRSLPS